MAELRGELPVHRYCLDQSPLPHALCYGGDDASVVVQFRSSVLDVATSTLYCLDGSERIAATAGVLLCVRFLFSERDVHMFNLGAYRPSRES